MVFFPHFISCLKSYMDIMFWETSLSCKVVMAQPKYKSPSSNSSHHGLLLTTYTRLFWCQIFSWLYPISPPTVLHIPTWFLRLNEPTPMMLSNRSFSYSLGFSHVLYCPFYHWVSLHPGTSKTIHAINNCKMSWHEEGREMVGRGVIWKIKATTSDNSTFQ